MIATEVGAALPPGLSSSCMLKSNSQKSTDNSQPTRAGAKQQIDDTSKNI